MNLIKTSLLSGISVAIKMITLLGINKVLAVYVGPAGYAAIGQFQNVVQIIMTFSSGAFNTGVTKYTAEYYYDEEKQKKVWRTASSVAVSCSILFGLAIILSSELLSLWLFESVLYKDVFFWLGVSLVFLLLNNLFLAILNGKKEIKLYVLASIFGSLFSLIITVILTILYGLIGALISLAVYQSLSFFVTVYLCTKTNWFKFWDLFGPVDIEFVKKLLRYSTMALTTAACVPVSHIMVRDHLSQSLGLEAAGNWEAMWRLSTAYLMLVTTTLSVYLLPRLSELEKTEEIRREIFHGYKIIMPFVLTSCLLIFYCREFIIEFLFSPEFHSMKALFGWQLVGDFLKIASWIAAYIFTAKALLGLFIFSEVFFALSFFVLTFFLTKYFGIQAASVAHAVNYLAYLLFVLGALRYRKII